MENLCRHCDKRIVLVNFSLGKSWVHQESGISFADNQHIYCSLTVAQPSFEGREVKITPIGEQGTDEEVSIVCDKRECGRCGAMILNEASHKQWHDLLDRAKGQIW